MEIDLNNFYFWLNSRLKKPLPGFNAQRKMMNIGRPIFNPIPANAKQSAVLLLIHPYQKFEPGLVFIQRSVDKSPHSGQIAFPGGKKEKEDQDFVETALREAYEEINLPSSQINVIGNLSPLYIPVSNFNVNPVLAFCDDLPPLKPCDKEVAAIITASIEPLFTQKRMVEVSIFNQTQSTVQVQAYALNDYQMIWGATAMILSELEELWLEWKCLK